MEVFVRQKWPTRFQIPYGEIKPEEIVKVGTSFYS